MVLDKWRARRRSFRELRRREAELYTEYLKMRQLEIDLKSGLAVADGLESSGYGSNNSGPPQAPEITVLQNDGIQSSDYGY
ncbi:hypothetical protein B7463_g4430, partial [Scytalidium lignicola]